MKFIASLLVALVAWLWSVEVFAADPVQVLGPSSPWNNNISAVESVSDGAVWVLRQEGQFYLAQPQTGQWSYEQLCTLEQLNSGTTSDYEGLSVTLWDYDENESPVYHFFALDENGNPASNPTHTAFAMFDPDTGDILYKWRIPSSALPLENDGGTGVGSEGLAVRYIPDEFCGFQVRVYIAGQKNFSGESKVYEFRWWNGPNFFLVTQSGWNDQYNAVVEHMMPYNESCGLDVLPSIGGNPELLYVLHGDIHRRVTVWNVNDWSTPVASYSAIGIPTPNNVEGICVDETKDGVYSFYACDDEPGSNTTEGVWFDADGL